MPQGGYRKPPERLAVMTYFSFLEHVSKSVQQTGELLASNLSLSEISEMIGMGNEYTFNRFFKRVEGMPPARFRNALRSSNYK